MSSSVITRGSVSRQSPTSSSSKNSVNAAVVAASSIDPLARNRSDEIGRALHRGAACDEAPSERHRVLHRHPLDRARREQVAEAVNHGRSTQPWMLRRWCGPTVERRDPEGDPRGLVGVGPKTDATRLPRPLATSAPRTVEVLIAEEGRHRAERLDDVSGRRGRIVGATVSALRTRLVRCRVRRVRCEHRGTRRRRRRGHRLAAPDRRGLPCRWRRRRDG